MKKTMNGNICVTKRQLERYPVYLKLLYRFKEEGLTTFSSGLIAKELKNSEEQVRKDLQIITRKEGKPGTGRDIDDIINDIETFLGYREESEAVVIGVGHLGEAFLKYKGFANYGLDVIAGFDIDPAKWGSPIAEKPVFPIERLEEMIPKLGVRIAILTTPYGVAQEMAERLVKCGIKGIWNFVPIHLNVDGDVIVENVDMAASLAVLSHKMKERLEGE